MNVPLGLGNFMKEYLTFVVLSLLLGKTGLPAEICATWFVCYLFGTVFPHSEEYLLESHPMEQSQQLLRTVTTVASTPALSSS